MSFLPRLCVGMESIMGGFARDSHKPSHYVIPAEAVRGMESIMGGFANVFNKPSRYVIPAEALRGHGIYNGRVCKDLKPK